MNRRSLAATIAAVALTTAAGVLAVLANLGMARLSSPPTNVGVLSPVATQAPSGAVARVERAPADPAANEPPRAATALEATSPQTSDPQTNPGFRARNTGGPRSASARAIASTVSTSAPSTGAPHDAGPPPNPPTAPVHEDD